MIFSFYALCISIGGCTIRGFTVESSYSFCSSVVDGRVWFHELKAMATSELGYEVD